MPAAAKIVLRLLGRAAWAPVGVFALNVYLSRGLHGYVRVPALDIPMHFMGGIAMAYFFSSCFRAVPEWAMAKEIRWAAEFVSVAGMTAMAAIFWELAEFGVDLLFASNASRGARDTLLDLALGILGGVVYLFVVGRAGKLGEVRPLT